VIPGWLYLPLPAGELGQISDPAQRIEVDTNRLKLQSDTRATMLQASPASRCSAGPSSLPTSFGLGATTPAQPI
jgi:hypothetical protein